MSTYRCDFHNHCRPDPVDVLGYSARELVDAAVHNGLHALAITPHRDPFGDQGGVVDYAREHGLLLIPGVERWVEGCEVVVLGVPPHFWPERPTTFEDLRTLRRAMGPELFVLAPHPFYPLQSCLKEKLEQNIDCFDAIEWCHFYTRYYNPNLRAQEVARRHGLPMLATSDCHDLPRIAVGFAAVEAVACEPVAIFEAIRAGLLQNFTRPLNPFELSSELLRVVLYQELVRRITRGPQKKPFFSRPGI